MSSTRRPRQPACAAHIMPAAPAPMTMTSYSGIRCRLCDAGCRRHPNRSASPAAIRHWKLRAEEFPDLVEPALGARVVLARIFLVDRLEFAQQVLLPRGELHRCLDRDVTIQVAVRR